MTPDRRFEALVLLRDALERGARVANARSLVESLEALEMNVAAVGPAHAEDDAARVLAELRKQGVPAELVLLAGEQLRPLAEREGAAVVSIDEESLLALLEDQLRRRREGDVPDVSSDPEWTLAFDGIDPELERAHEALLTIADGRLGTRGGPLTAHPAASPGVLAAGIYRGEGPGSELLPCPIWSRLLREPGASGRLRRVLDLRSGLLRHDLETADGPVRALLFSSFARPGTVVLRAGGPPSLFEGDVRLVPPPGTTAAQAGDEGERRWMRVTASPGGVACAAVERRRADNPRRALDRIGAYRADPALAPAPADALASLREAEEAGFESLLAEHRQAWARRWESADVVVEGDPELERAVRFALFHLMASVADSGEAAVGARGLSGPGYRGHVFWDSDVFVLPFLAATHPPAARAMLEYRVRRLPAARAAARAAGRAGARFPWESEADGVDVTPRSAVAPDGTAVPILTGLLEEHISADVAWSAACYADWTDDRAFAGGPGLELLVETARYWASRLRIDDAGTAHIERVIGPDEYHEAVDDNAFTNVMARWNLRRAARAAEAAGTGVDEPERRRWLELADALVDGYSESTGLYEQFAGFFELEPLVIADIAPRRPIAADLLLGRERVAGAQVVKQADVLMLHQLVPGEVAAGSLEPNLAFYEPRTAHGSSLSPAVHASLLARAGRLDEALAWLRLASRIDLDDVTRTTAGGLHLATMGGLWQALAYGFAGLRPAGAVLHLDPRLPDAWRALEVRVRFRGTAVRVRAEHELLRLETDGPVSVAVAGGTPLGVDGVALLERRCGGWQETRA